MRPQPRVLAAAVLAALCLAACAKKEPVQPAAPAAQAPAVDNAATQYVDSLQRDVKKAQDTAAKANAAIRQKSQSVDETLQDGGGN